MFDERDDVNRIKTNILWQDSVENLLKRWGEQATAYRLLHYKAYYRFRYKTIAITLPVIVLQSICGSTSIGLSSLFETQNQHAAQIGVGVVSLITSMLVTISNYLQYAELKQAHHHAMVAYGKLARDIRTTLSLYRKDRPDAGNYLGMCKHSLDRLTEDSPTIPDDISKKFKKRYRKSKVSKPDICDELTEIIVTREENILKYLDINTSGTTDVGNFDEDDEDDDDDDDGGGPRSIIKQLGKLTSNITEKFGGIIQDKKEEVEEIVEELGEELDEIENHTENIINAVENVVDEVNDVGNAVDGVGDTINSNDNNSESGLSDEE